MENKNLLGIILLLLILMGGVMCFFAGMKYEERQRRNDGFQFNLGEEVQIDTGKGRVKAPFVDIEYEK